MRSMTGYGRGTCQAFGRRVTVEIRTVNHRFFDMKLRSPWIDASFEAQVSARVRQSIERGAITVGFRDDLAAEAAPEVRVNVPLAKGYFGALETLRRELGLQDPVPLELLAQMRDVIVVGEPEVSGEALYLAVRPALEAALEALASMRALEGQALGNDMRGRLGRLEALRGDIAGYAAAAPELYKKRLEERLARLLKPGDVDPARLAQEVAVLADRSDVSEELVRLDSHFAQFGGLLAETGPVGRKLEFVLQEINREFNTIASKLPGAGPTAGELSHRVVEAKAELEKLREQVQNVE